jgi:hypothetical protein
VSILLKRGADVNTTDYQGTRPLDAALESDKDVADLIKRYGGQRFDMHVPVAEGGEASAEPAKAEEKEAEK